jgi:NtrC-family two-component system sensor histidine kinase KinB
VESQEVNALLATIGAMQVSLDLPQVLDTIVMAVTRGMNYPTVILSTIDEHTQTLRVRAAAAEPGRLEMAEKLAGLKMTDFVVSLDQKDNLGIQAALTGEVAVTHRFADCLQGTVDNSTADAIQQLLRIRSIAITPLIAKGKLIGNLVAGTGREQIPSHELDALWAVATQAAIAIDNASLFEETRRRLNEVATLYTLASEITGSLDLQQVLNKVVVSMRHITRCRGCCIFLLDEKGEVLEIKAADGVSPRWQQEARLRVGEGISGKAVAERRVVYVPDTRQAPDFVPFDPTVRSILAVPLIVKDRVIGALNIDDSSPDAFNPEQERLLTITAAQAAIVIENARLFAEIMSAKRRNDAIITHMADGLLMLDPQGHVVSLNPALEKMLGIKEKEVLGQLVTDSETDSRLAAICQRGGEEELGGVTVKEISLSEPADRTFKVFASDMRDSSGNHLGEVRVLHDVTRERELDRLKDDFISFVVHELRTPLSAILGFVQLILDDQVPDTGTQREFLTIVKRQAAQLGTLVDNLLDLSRLESGLIKLKEEPVSMSSVLQQVGTKMQGLAQSKGIALEVTTPADLLTVIGDDRWLEQVVTNLVGNAIKFTPEGGRVTVSGEVEGPEVLIEIADTGPGIPAEALELIFSKFYRVSNVATRAAEGTGLGLYIARKAVESHGGRIWVESTVGEGSTFRFALPALATQM